MKISRHMSSESLADWVLTDKNILRFLALYRVLDYLWNPRHPMYRDTILRGRIYDEIARQMQVCLVDDQDCLKFMKYLKRKYLEEKKIKKDKDERPKWFLVIDKMVKDVAYPCKTPTSSTVSLSSVTVSSYRQGCGCLSDSQKSNYSTDRCDSSCNRSCASFRSKK